MKISFSPDSRKDQVGPRKMERFKTQVENLDAPDNVYRLVKHHLNDFLDSLKFTIEEKEHNPEAPLLDFVYYLQEIARCDRRSNEVRLDLLTRKLQAFHENQDLILNLIHTQYGENEASLSSAFARARLDMQRDQKLLNEYFRISQKNRLHLYHSPSGFLSISFRKWQIYSFLTASLTLKNC